MCVAVPLSRRLLAPASLLTLALTSACGADLTLPSDAVPAALVVISGDEQSGSVGAQLPQPLVVEVRDAAGRPVPGVGIGFRFARSAAGAHLSPGSVTSSARGRASTRVVLPASAGSQVVEAYLTGKGMPPLRATFLLTARTVARGTNDGSGSGADGTPAASGESGSGGSSGAGGDHSGAGREVGGQQSGGGGDGGSDGGHDGGAHQGGDAGGGHHGGSGHDGGDGHDGGGGHGGGPDH